MISFLSNHLTQLVSNKTGRTFYLDQKLAQNLYWSKNLSFKVCIGKSYFLFGLYNQNKTIHPFILLTFILLN